MYDAGPSDEELEAIGLLREDVEDTSITEIWPENMLPFQVFNEISSQWRVGMNGPTALDQNFAFSYMDRMGLKYKKQLEVIRAIKVMESAALGQINKSRKG